MSQFTKEKKIEIYEKRLSGYTLKEISLIFKIELSNLKYLIRLIDLHGYDILKEENNYYPPKLKQEIINKVLIEGQSVLSTSIEYGLPSRGILHTWIKVYKENNCIIVEKKRGRDPTMTKKYIKKKYQDMTDEEKIKYLEEKNIYLEAENTYLKKLKAVIQNRKKHQSKKK